MNTCTSRTMNIQFQHTSPRENFRSVNVNVKDYHREKFSGLNLRQQYSNLKQSNCSNNSHFNLHIVAESPSPLPGMQSPYLRQQQQQSQQPIFRSKVKVGDDYRSSPRNTSFGGKLPDLAIGARKKNRHDHSKKPSMMQISTYRHSLLEALNREDEQKKNSPLSRSPLISGCFKQEGNPSKKQQLLYPNLTTAKQRKRDASLQRRRHDIIASLSMGNLDVFQK